MSCQIVKIQKMLNICKHLFDVILYLKYFYAGNVYVNCYLFGEKLIIDRIRFMKLIFSQIIIFYFKLTICLVLVYHLNN